MKTIVRSAGEGEQRWFFGGGLHTWKVLADETGGALSIFEDTLARGKSTPLHTHPDHEEVIFVIEGEILIFAEGTPITVRAGGLVINQRGVPHAFTVTSERARILAIQTPGAKAESFYRAASTPGTEGDVDFSRIGAAAKDTGATVILGPPPFARP